MAVPSGAVSDLELRIECAARLRTLADHLASDELPYERWQQVAQVLAEVEGSLPVSPQLTRFARSVAAATPRLAGAEGNDPPHPVASATSGVFPPLSFAWGTGALVAETTFGPAWEGPPGLVHGGFLAAGFDIVLSALASQQAGPSVTRYLRFRYLRPTPLGASVRFEVEGSDPAGRLLDLRGALLLDGRVTMRAEAQFATLTPARFSAATLPGPG